MGLLDPERSAELESHLSACRSASEEVRSSKIAELRAQDPELAERLQRALEQAAIPTLNALGAAPPAAPGAPTSTRSGLRHLAEHSSQPSEPGAAARDGPAGVEPAASGIFPGLEGRRFGPYRVLRLLGRGGMGSVWLAERVDGLFERQVALKVMHAALLDTEQRERFARERQIVGALRHPMAWRARRSSPRWWAVR